MEAWFKTSSTAIIAIAITAICIYISVIVFTRFFGKRSFSKMSSFDFAMTVAIGSIIAATILNKSVSLLQGMFGLFVVYFLQFAVALFRRCKPIQNAIDNEPLLLMNGNEILHQNLKKARVTMSDLRSKLREANVIELSEVKAVVFETTGDISVLHTTDASKQLDDLIMEDVQH